MLTETWSGPVTGSVGRTYNTDFRAKTFSVNGTALAFGYDNDGLITQAGSLTLAREPATGFVSATTLGSVTTSQSHTSFGELQTLTAAVSGAAVFSNDFIYDNASRLSEKAETVDGQTNRYAYSYDPAGRLIQVNKNGTPISNYVYDDNGNRLSWGGYSGSYDAQDRLLQYGNATYSYTANGELMSKTEAGQTTSYGYDVLGNLKSVTLPDGTVIEYVIDGRNRRVGKKVNGVLTQGFLYQDQLKPFAQLDGNNAITARFVYATKTNVPEYMVKGGISYRIISDYLGSVRLVINTSDGTVVQRMDYDEFGNVTLDSNPGFQPFGFAGGLLDQHTKLTRFGTRDYDAQTGRWVAKDPIRFAGGDTNLFGYVGNDPVNLIDPLGLDPWWNDPSLNKPAITNITFDRAANTITYSNENGTVVGSYPAGNRTVNNNPWPLGTYSFSYWKDHPENTTSYGQNGNFVFDVPGHSGMGLHSGRSSPQSRTMGCIRSTDDATKDLYRRTDGGKQIGTITVK